MTDPEQITQTRSRAEEMSARLKTLRKEVKMCESIQKRAPVMAEKVRQVEQDENALQQDGRKINDAIHPLYSE